MKQQAMTTAPSSAAAEETELSPVVTAPMANAVASVQARAGNSAAQDALAANVAGTASGLPGTKSEAIARQAEGVRRTRALLAAGLAQEVDPGLGAQSRQNLLHNAAEWLDAGEAVVQVLAPVHDSAQRPSIPGGQIGYFDATRTIDDGTPSYDETLLGDQPQIKPEFDGVVGAMSTDGTTLSLYDPAHRPEGTLAEAIIHEVLHDADQHDNGAWDEGITTGRAPSWAYDSYMTEFRAYWFESAEGSAADAFESSSDTSVGQHTVSARNGKGVLKTAATSFKNRRQESIWLHLRGDDRPAGDWLDAKGEWTQPYAYLGFYYVLDPAFQTMVDDYERPRDGNAIASVRIQRLSEAIGISCGDVDMDAVLGAAVDLDDLDRAWLSDQLSSRPFWEQARATLEIDDLRALRAAVIGDGTSAVADEAQRYRVVAGDTLGTIADRMLGDSSRWKEIHDLNRNVIGPNPDTIRPGQRLALPLP